MKKINLRSLRISLITLLGVAGMSLFSAKAEVINLTGLENNFYNTGVESDDATLEPGNPGVPGTNNPADLHYTMTYYANGAGSSPATVLPPMTYAPGDYGMTPTSSGPAFIAEPIASSQYAGESWAPNLSDAQWITYSADMTDKVNQTPFTAVTVFELDLKNIPQNVEITLGGMVAADDNVTIYGNGKELFTDFSAADDGVNNNGNFNQYTTLSDLSFLSGKTNTLDFVVYNNGGYPTGLVTQLTGSYSLPCDPPAPTPEPSTYALLTAGLGLLVFLRRRQAAKA